MKDKISMKRYIDTRFETIIRRTDFFWKEVTPKRVGEYLNQLKADKDSMEKAFNIIDTPFNLNKDYVDGFLRAFDNEIELAKFYLELHKAKKDPNFNKWVYLKEEEKNKEIKEDWKRKAGDVWIISNGTSFLNIAMKKDNMMS